MIKACKKRSLIDIEVRCSLARALELMLKHHLNSIPVYFSNKTPIVASNSVVELLTFKDRHYFAIVTVADCLVWLETKPYNADYATVGDCVGSSEQGKKICVLKGECGLGECADVILKGFGKFLVSNGDINLVSLSDFLRYIEDNNRYLVHDGTLALFKDPISMYIKEANMFTAHQEIEISIVVREMSKRSLSYGDWCSNLSTCC